MKYRYLGNSGLKVSELSFGSWVTFGSQVDVDKAVSLMKIAYEAGVNFFDNAEVYSSWKAPEIVDQLTADVVETIEGTLDNKPESPPDLR